MNLLKKIQVFMRFTSIIPKGDYCYSNLSLDPKRPGKFHTNTCPYFQYQEVNGVHVAWCKFLGCGSVINGTNDEQYQKLLEHYGSEESLEAHLPLMLLWDQVKECRMNEEENGT
jgi:hypothetical protein